MATGNTSELFPSRIRAAAFLALLTVFCGPWQLVAAGRIWTGFAAFAVDDNGGGFTSNHDAVTAFSRPPTPPSTATTSTVAVFPTYGGYYGGNSPSPPPTYTPAYPPVVIDDFTTPPPSESPSTGSTELPDPPAPLVRHPPAPLTGYDTQLLNQLYGNGWYRVRASSVRSASEAGWKAFDGLVNTGTGHMWTDGAANLYDQNLPYRYLGTASTTVGDEEVHGEWIQIQLPHRVEAVKYALWTRDRGMQNRGPKDFKLLGSNDGTYWALLDEQTGIWNWTPEGLVFSVSDAGNYSYYRLVVGSNNGGGWLTLFEMSLYAYPDPSDGMDLVAPPPAEISLL